MARSVKIIAVQLEPCHANTDGSAWYVYVEGLLSDLFDNLGVAGVEAELEDLVKESGVPLGIEFAHWEEAPTALSQYARLQRYYVGAAV